MVKRALSMSWIAMLCAALCACAEQHGPKTSTETGNPPLIEAAQIELVMLGDDVHMVGDKGAVSPGGSELAARNLTTSKVTRGKAAQDGSFDLTLDGTIDDVYELRAGSGYAMTDPLFVDRDGAGAELGDAGTVGTDGGEMSCERQEQLGANALAAAVANAELDCTDDSDCVRASTNAVCHDSCQEVIVSTAGKERIDSTVNIVNVGICGTYERDGCMLIIPPCVLLEPGSPACVAGKCELGPLKAEGSCDGRASMATAEVEQAAAEADRQCASASDCALAPSVDFCAKACETFPVSLAGLSQVAEVSDATLERVCGDYFSDGCTSAIPMCVAQRAACHAGLCELAADTCDERITQAQGAVNAAVDSADRTCTIASDCVAAATATSCLGGCGAVVSKSGKSAIDDAVAAINDTWCYSFEPSGCVLENPQCPTTGTIACIAGTCGYAPSLARRW